MRIIDLLPTRNNPMMLRHPVNIPHPDSLNAKVLAFITTQIVTHGVRYRPSVVAPTCRCCLCRMIRGEGHSMTLPSRILLRTVVYLFNGLGSLPSGDAKMQSGVSHPDTIIIIGISMIQEAERKPPSAHHTSAMIHFFTAQRAVDY